MKIKYLRKVEEIKAVKTKAIAGIAYPAWKKEKKVEWRNSNTYISINIDPNGRMPPRHTMTAGSMNLIIKPRGGGNK